MIHRPSLRLKSCWPSCDGVRGGGNIYMVHRMILCMWFFCLGVFLIMAFIDEVFVVVCFVFDLFN